MFAQTKRSIVWIFGLAEDETIWNTVLKNQYFPGKTITESDAVITIDAPYRAEDPALVPLKIIGRIPQSKDRYIKKILVLVDNNPFPYVGEFEFTQDSGKADLAMRVRVNTYSFVRAVAEMNDGRLFMASLPPMPRSSDIGDVEAFFGE